MPVSSQLTTSPADWISSMFSTSNVWWHYLNMFEHGFKQNFIKVLTTIFKVLKINSNLAAVLAESYPERADSMAAGQLYAPPGTRFPLRQSTLLTLHRKRSL